MRRWIVVAVAALVTSACANGGRRPEPVTVFAAASLTAAFTDLQATVAADDHVRVTYSFAGSQALATQIEQGAPADVFAAADQATMAKLVDAGLVDGPVAFAGNTLTIAVRPGNPKHITGLRDLARPDLTVVLADPSVPAGAYTARALAKVATVVRPRSLELDVKAALTKVTTGEADAAVVYRTDVQAAGSKADAVAIPADENVTVTYPIAVVRSTRHRTAARAFVRAVLGTAGRRALRARGFVVSS